MQTLQPQTTLQSGKYKIISTLGQGGFGITYLAENTMLDGKMAIKEFFFKEYCDRDESTSHVTIPTSGNREIVERFKLKFIKEARTIFKLNHPNIVGIHDIFEENGTAYYVMDYIEGESLGDMVKRRGAIPEAEALGYIKEVGKALSYIHSEKMTHLDIKPGNIMRRAKDGRILVIDFGVAKQYDTVTDKGTTTTPVGISAGYSPSEQYKKNGVGEFSPQSDVYALAATLFKLLTDNTPPEAMEVQDDGLPVDELRAKGVSRHVIKAIESAMQSRSKRTQSVDAFMTALDDGFSINQTSGNDDEKTFLISDVQRVDEENKYKEARAKATKYRTKGKAHSQAEAEKKVKDVSGRGAYEVEEQSTRSIEETGEVVSKKNTSKMWLAITAIVFSIILVIVFSYLNSQPKENDLSYKNDTITKEILSETKINNYEYVDLGLPSQTLWATCNIGASQIEDDGLYFAYGETTMRDNYNWKTYKFTKEVRLYQSSIFTRYYNNGGEVSIAPNSGDDAAREQWGGTWRMPSKKDVDELIKKCVWKWESLNGKMGYRVTGPNNKSIFLPASGGRMDREINFVGESGCYRTSSLTDDDDCAWVLSFDKDDISSDDNRRRDAGMSIRAVSDPKTKM